MYLQIQLQPKNVYQDSENTKITAEDLNETTIIEIYILNKTTTGQLPPIILKSREDLLAELYKEWLDHI